MPVASTGTMVPSTKDASSGVMNVTPTVVAVVMMTDNATSPLAMYVHKLEACPPLMEPMSTQPATSGSDSPAALAIPSASSGIMA